MSSEAMETTPKKKPFRMATTTRAKSDAPKTRVHRIREKELRSNRIVAPFIGNYEADVFRMLRTRVLKRLDERGGKTLGICSCREGEGKSVVAINLAMSLALDVNHTVLLVELDLRMPSMDGYLGLNVKKGLSDVLSGQATVSECLINLGMERFTVLPAHEPMPYSSEALASPDMHNIVLELRNRYPDRLIIYDLPPVLLTDDAMAFMDHLDALLFVVAEGKTKKADLQRAVSLIDEKKLIGTVLNGAEKPNRKDDYYYYKYK